MSKKDLPIVPSHCVYDVIAGPRCLASIERMRLNRFQILVLAPLGYELRICGLAASSI